ncbi:EthD domain-containing protein [Limnobacter sp.]|uniref:EthD domain-containing protein n=1 Tax=Limnobacter sp. TaxID=2003368 RepID=UPI0025BAE7FC|nr:EthD domain-containing protein [Limnobacter sp.]
MKSVNESNEAHRRKFLKGAMAAGLGSILVGCGGSEAISAVSDDSGRETEASANSDSPVVKLTCVIRKRQDLSRAEFYRYWLEEHAPLATELVKTLGAFRYVQSHTLDTNLNPLLRASRFQYDTVFEGITEVWFPSEDELISKMASAEGILANSRLALDESTFINLTQSSYFFTKEYEFLNTL